MTVVHAAFVLLAVASVAAIDSRLATAETYRPWCVDYPPTGVSCAFTSYEQCMLTARGAGASCVQNPWYLKFGSGQKGTESTGQGERSRRR